ncbi:MAG: hypothetical protein WAN23_04885 [Candidatus Acidiferrales bacterium]
MDTIEQPGRLSRAATYGAIAGVVYLAVLALVLHLNPRDWLWEHPWWHSFLVGLPAIVFALIECVHSNEANRLRAKLIQTTSELSTERNKHLGRIADNTERQPSRAELNAKLLKKYLNMWAKVSEGSNNWASAAQVVEISENNIAALFIPADYTSGSASRVNVDCTDVQIVEVPVGSCSIQLTVLKRYGRDIPLGQITKWEERDQPKASVFPKAGGAAAYAQYSKGGSSERRTLHIYPSTDGTNSFLLEASTGESLTGDNKQISKAFRSMDVDYKAEGFHTAGSGSGGGSAYPLFL